MAASDIRIASNALLLLGHTTIASFDEGTAGATIAANLYQSSYEALLTNYRWRFASKKVKLARLTEKPLDYDFKYQLPADLLYLTRTLIINANYEIFEDTLHANVETVEIEYIYNIPADRLPAYYSKTLEFFLASQFALSLTGDLAKKQAMDQSYLFALKQASARRQMAIPATSRI